MGSESPGCSSGLGRKALSLLRAETQLLMGSGEGGSLCESQSQETCAVDQVARER